MEKKITITLPKLGESILNATVVQWFKNVGDFVEADEPLLEVSTDKVNSEIPSPESGYIKEILAQADEEVEVDDPLCVLVAEKSEQIEEKPSPKEAKPAAEEAAQKSSMRTFFSPVVLRLASEKGVDLEELKTIRGTGAGGRISKKDLEAYLAEKEKAEPAHDLQIERVKMSNVRKAIADNMVRSFYEAPHASLVTEIDVSDVMKLIKEEKESFLQKHGCKLTITSFIAKAIANAVQEYPIINSSLEDDTIILKHFVNLGIAVSVDQGIVVPVIKHCHRLKISEIAKKVAKLSKDARNHTLTPDDVKEGTITMTNFGMAGTLIGIPIIRYPEVAIVGIGAITKKVVPLSEDSFGIRSIMHASLTFDHRVLDGMYGCGFLGSLKKHLEEFDSHQLL